MGFTIRLHKFALHAMDRDKKTTLMKVLTDSKWCYSLFEVKCVHFDSNRSLVKILLTYLARFSCVARA